MDKITYLAELAEGLARWVPYRERQDILRWYAEYFEEAGPEREAEVVAELGDPWALSCRLAVEGGYVTEEKAASWRPKKRWPKILIGTAVGLTVFTLVFGSGLLGLTVLQIVTGFTLRTNAVTQAVPETVYDWSVSPVWGEYELFMEDPEGAMGYYLLDGESMAPFSTIDADISLGNIEVVAGDDFTLSIRRGEALLGYEPELSVRDGVLRLRDSDQTRVIVNSWDDLKNLFSTVDQTAIYVTITVPVNARLDEVSVRTGLGDVLLYGVNAETVTAETGMGNVECYEAWNVKQMELNTGMGNVNLLLSEVRQPGADISLESGMGNVEASLACWEEDCAYELESGLGHVTVNGGTQNSRTQRRGDLPYTLRAESGMGDVSVYFI